MSSSLGKEAAPSVLDSSHSPLGLSKDDLVVVRLAQVSTDLEFPSLWKTVLDPADDPRWRCEVWNCFRATHTVRRRLKAPGPSANTGRTSKARKRARKGFLVGVLAHRAGAPWKKHGKEHPSDRQLLWGRLDAKALLGDYRSHQALAVSTQAGHLGLEPGLGEPSWAGDAKDLETQRRRE